MQLRQFLDSLDNAQLIDRLNLALDGANLGIWDWDLRDNSVQFDRRWCEMLGLDHDKVPMELSSWEERVHPEDLPGCYSDIKRYLDGETPYYENIHRMRHANGEWIYILDRGRISGHAPDGTPIRFTGTHFDCTATERARRVLEREQELAANLVRNLPTAVAMFDQEGRYLAASHQWLALHEADAADLIGIRDTVIWDAARWDDLRTLAHQGTSITSDDAEWVSHDRLSGWFRWTVQPWHHADDQIGGVVVMIHDASLEIQRREEREHDARLSALGMMAAGVAHEINTPLQTLSLNAGMITDELGQDTPSQELIGDCAFEIAQTIARIERVVGGLRILSRDQRNDPPISVAVAPLVDEVAELSAGRLRAHGIAFSLDTEIADHLHVTTLPAFIGQILINLLNNAYDAVVDSAEPWIRLHVSEDEHAVFFDVEDSGVGVPLELRGKIMTPFFTTKPLGRGTGLGLSLSQSLAKKVGGGLTCRPGLPSCFRLRIPKDGAPQ